VTAPAGRRVLVTGVTGQLGYYVADQLTREGHTVFGLERQTTLARGGRGAPVPYQAVSGDLLDDFSLMTLLESIQPDEVYNFAAQSFIPASWQQPTLTAQYTAMGVVRLLEALRRVVPRCRFLQAGSSELFAGGTVSPQDETTAVIPRNPYGVAKAFAHHSVKVYREHYDLFAANAIFFTNESPRRSPEFLFRKVTHGVAAIKAGRAESLSLGSLDAYRDWGWAPDFADAAIRVLRSSQADDFVIATGEAHTVGDLVQLAFSFVGLAPESHLRIDPAFVRATESNKLVGIPKKAAELLGWQPTVRFREIVRRLLAHDLTSLGLDPAECMVPDLQ
jgi:GDPmannose 4,6-dehydratase